MFWVKNGLKIGDSYAVQTGDYVGEIFIFIENKKNKYCFLATPELLNREVPKDKFDLAVEEGIIEYIERLPRYVRKTARAKFQENKSKLFPSA